jgi:hypothetical protein
MPTYSPAHRRRRPVLLLTPGQTNGQGVVLNGGLWTVVSPAGAPLPSAGPANSGPSY